MLVRILAFAALIAGTAACGALGNLTAGSAKPPVAAARLAPGGRGLFVVRPPPGAAGCTIAVAGSEQPIECDNEYLVSCDATQPEDERFCRVMPEVSPVRESIYPARVR